MSAPWWAWLFPVGFVAAFVHDLIVGKTITFPLGTFDRHQQPFEFWMAQAITGSLGGLCLYYLVVGSR